MSLDVASLQAMSTVALRALRQDYMAKRRGLTAQHITRAQGNFPTDQRRCDDAIDMINRILRARRVSRRPLGEFA